MTDRTLFPLPPATANLTTRQQIVFDHLQANPDGVRTIDIARHLHRTQSNSCRHCSAKRTCQYASRDANEILRSLRGHSQDPHARRLVAYRITGVWVPLVRAENDTGTFPDDF